MTGLRLLTARFRRHFGPLRGWLFSASIVVCVILGTCFATLALIRANQTANETRRESNIRTRQICELINGTHAERIARYRGTVAYLRSPAGHEDTPLNNYIRKASLPQTRDEIRSEAARIPSVCRRG